MTPPAFTVVIPCRNAADTLAATLDSVLAQSFPHWEALVVDDTSADASAGIATRYAAKDTRFRLCRLARDRPQGIAAARNHAIAQARGDFVAFLDADDIWLPEKLALQAQAFAEGADIVFGSYRRVDAQGRALGVVVAAPRVTYARALSGNPIGCLTGAYRRAAFPGARMPARGMHEDYRFWLSLLRGGVTAVGLPQVLGVYRVAAGSASSNKAKAARAVWDILGDEGLALPRRVWHFSRYALRSVQNRL